jgi:hypothetical protein
LLLLVGAAGFMAVFFGVYNVLGVGMPYFGLLFLVYWAAFLRQEAKAFLPSVLGGLCGILMGWLLIGMPPLVGAAGSVIAAVVLVAMLFCFMRGHATLLVNNATMLFLTVATVPELKIGANAVVMAESLLLGAVYMGAVTAAAHAVTKRLPKKSPAPSSI